MLLGVAAAIAVGFFGWSLVHYLNSRGTDVQHAQPTRSPEVAPTESPISQGTSAPPSSPADTPAPDPTPPESPSPSPPESPSPVPTESPTPEPEPTPEPTPTSETSEPPDLPVPRTWDEAEQWLLDNPLYRESVKVPTNCAVARIDITTAGVPELEAHIEELLDCAMKVWAGPLERAGWLLPRPSVTVYSEAVTTACGTLPTHNAYYCSGDQRLYYATDLPEVYAYYAPGVLNNAFIIDTVMAHEFGHAIQGRTGIWIAYAAFRQRAKDEAEWLEYSRRSEVQADCLSGMFLNAVTKATKLTKTEREGIPQIIAALGDDTLGEPGKPGDHGLGATRSHWAETGLKSKKVSACNTWTAPAKQVR